MPSFTKKKPTPLLLSPAEHNEHILKLSTAERIRETYRVPANTPLRAKRPGFPLYLTPPEDTVRMSWPCLRHCSHFTPVELSSRSRAPFVKKAPKKPKIKHSPKANVLAYIYCNLTDSAIKARMRRAWVDAEKEALRRQGVFAAFHQKQDA